MAVSAPRNVLVVANRTAATPALLAEVRRRAAEGACRFTLLVSRSFWDADTEESAIALELATPLLEDACGGRVEGLIGPEDAFLAVSSDARRRALRRGDHLDAADARVALAPNGPTRAR